MDVQLNINQIALGHPPESRPPIPERISANGITALCPA